MEFLERMIQVIEYVEEHITESFNYKEVADIAGCNIYQFGRIFSYVVGIPFSEYVRNRRLSLAAIELQEGKRKVIDVALMYGYNSPESFARAFREQQGISPKEASVTGVKLKMYPRITFQITVKGDVDMEYRIEKKGVIKGVGVVRNFGSWEVSSEKDDWKGKMGERWAYWDEFLNGGMNSRILQYELYREPFYQMGVTYTLENGDIVEAIGAEADGRNYPDLMEFEVPASTWAVFSSKGTLQQDEHPMDALTTKIFSEWLPSSGYERSMNYEIQVYGPGDASSDDYISELWIPVKKKK